MNDYDDEGVKERKQHQKGVGGQGRTSKQQSTIIELES